MASWKSLKWKVRAIVEMLSSANHSGVSMINVFTCSGVSADTPSHERHFLDVRSDIC